MKYSKSSDFIRMEMELDFGIIGVYEFHKVVNGNMYYYYHEEKDGFNRYRGEDKPIKDKEHWDRCFNCFLKEGFKVVGEYEMDVCGYKYKKEVSA